MTGSAKVFAARLCVAAAAVCAVVANAQASTVWHNDWVTTAALGSSFGSPQLSKLLDSGELLLAYDTFPGQSILHLRADGSLRWQFALAADRPLGVGDMAALPSGSVALTYNEGRDHVALLSANGELLWDTAVVASYIAVSGGNLYTVGCRDNQPVVTALALGDGGVRWQQVIGTANCARAGATVAIVADNDGGIVATFARGQLSGTRTLTKLAADGSLGWTRELATQQESISPYARLYRHADNFYLEGDSQLAAFRGSDGQPLWQHDCALSTAFFGADTACIEGLRNFVRLSAADGGVVWRRQLPSSFVHAGDGTDLYVISDGSWQRISGNTGATVWSQPFPGRTHYSYLWLNGLLGQARALVFGADQKPQSLGTFGLDDGVLQRADALPQLDRNLYGALLRVDGSDVFIAGATSSIDSRLRRLSADSGAVVWENHLPLSSVVSLGVTPASVTVAENLPGTVQIRSIVRDSGRNRWSRTLALNPNRIPVSLFGTAQDDVLVAGFVDSAEEQRSRLWRLSGSDGSERWSRPVRLDSDTSSQSKHIFVGVGNDLVSADTYPLPSNTQRIDTTSGQTLWTQASYPDSPPSHAAATPGNDALYFVEASGQPPKLTRRSALDGSSHWSLPLTIPATGTRTAGLTTLADGDALVAVNTRLPDGSPSWRFDGPPQLLRLRADGSGVRYHWQGSTPPAGFDDQVGPVRIDTAAATAWVRRKLSVDGFSLAVLERFDLATDRHLGAQFYGAEGAPLQFPSTAWDADFVLYQGRILSGGSAAAAPATSARRHALRDFHIASRGDLALTLAPLAPAAAGSLQALDVRVSYSGDAPTTATLFVDPPWPLDGTAPVCGGSGISGCSVDTRLSPWLVRFTAAPGAQLQFSGLLRVLAAPAPTHARIRALVFGPENLLEPSGSNNIAASAPLDSLFADGFEQVLQPH